jgi:UDP-N-acetylglucosamine pyrophosphorylase
MLHDILWNGLRKELKDASGHKYDSIKDFDSLRVAIRQMEMKHTLEQQLYEKEKKSKPNPTKAAQVTHVASVLLRMGVWLPYPWLDP